MLSFLRLPLPHNALPLPHHALPKWRRVSFSKLNVAYSSDIQQLCCIHELGAYTSIQELGAHTS